MKFLEGVPDILYKYRDWRNPFNQRLLTHNELFFSSVDLFNDPFDGTIPFRYKPEQLTEENIFLKYRQLAKLNNPRWTEEEIHTHCYDIQRRGLMHDEQFLQQGIENTKADINKNFGIVSLTSANNNFLMWSHYSNSHSGFSVGFDKYLLFEQTQSAFTPVAYQNEFPLIDLFGDPISFVHKLVCTKWGLWEYENEYRLVKIHFARKTIELSPETFKEIIFGCKMLHSIKLELLELIKSRFPKAQVFESSLNKHSFNMDIMRIM